MEKIDVPSRPVTEDSRVITSASEPVAYAPAERNPLMQSKLSLFCERLIEAGWLAAVITTPLFFNVYSNRVFEPDKISVLRSLALMMSAAWIVKWVDDVFGSGARQEANHPSLWQRIRRTPLIVPTLLMMLSYLLSTALSVVPRVSFFGSYQRLQGTYTTFSYIVIFFLILAELRRRDQLERLLFAIIFSSIPISLYGIVQKMRLDPLPWGGDVIERVAANMGNSIFVAAYLIMAFFITLERAIDSIARLIRSENSPVRDSVIAGCYLFVLAVQLLAIEFTQSRGPWLGLAVGIYVFILLGLIAMRQRTQRAATQTAAARRLSLLVPLWAAALPVAIAFLVLLNLSNGPLQGLRKYPVLNRLGSILELDSGTNKVRVLIWQGAVQLVTPHAAEIYPDGHTDPLNPIRPLVGYGPESMWVVYNPFYPPDLAHYEARNASPDRSHNETFDSLVITGLIGFITYLALFTSLFYVSLKWLGLITNKLQRNLMIGTMLAGAIAFVAIFRVTVGNWELSGVAVAVGLLLGFIIYTTVAALRLGAGAGASGRRQLLLIALLSTLVAHFMEIHTGIAIVSTRTHFWVLVGVLCLVGMGWISLESSDTPIAESVPVPAQAQDGKTIPVAVHTAAATTNNGRKNSSRKRRAGGPASNRPATTLSAAGRRPTPGGAAARRLADPLQGNTALLGISGIAAVIFITLAFDYLTNSPPSLNPMDVVIHAITTKLVDGQPQTGYGIAVLLFFTWVVGGAIGLGEVARAREAGGYAKADNNWWLGSFLIYSAATWGAFWLFGLIHASRLVEAAVLQQERSLRAVQELPGLVASYIHDYYAGLFVLVFLLAASLWWSRAQGLRKPLSSGWTGALTVVGALIMAFVLINAWNLSLVRGDIYYKQGLSYDNAQQWDASIDMYNKALAEQPLEDFYYLFLGRSELEKAKATTNPADRDRLMTQTLDTLLKAQRLNPLNTDHTANLGRLYRAWGELTTSDPKLREDRLNKALEYYREATTLSPNAAHLWNEYGLVDQIAGHNDEALAKYNKSLSLDTQFDQTYLFLGDLYRSQNNWDKAAEAYANAVKISPDLVAGHSALGFVYAQQGNTSGAIAENMKVLAQAPNDLSAHRNLALLYQQTGQLNQALQQAQAARQVAPDSDKAALDQLIAQLKQQGAK